MKEVTIILPVYSPNYKHLEECLKSISSQTIDYSKYYLIIGCDGQINKQIKRLLDEYTNKNKFSSYKIFERGGLKNTLNKLVKLCKTKYLARMDADDIMDIKRIETQLNFLKCNPNVKLLGTALKLFPNKKFKTKFHPTNTFTIILFGALYGNPFSHPSIMCESQILKQTLYKEDSPYEDYGLWYRFASHGDLANLNIPLVKYRIHNDQISNQKLSYMKMINIRIKYAKVFFKKYPIITLLILPIFILLFLPHRRTI